MGVQQSSAARPAKKNAIAEWGKLIGFMVPAALFFHFVDTSTVFWQAFFGCLAAMGAVGVYVVIHALYKDEMEWKREEERNRINHSRPSEHTADY